MSKVAVTVRCLPHLRVLALLLIAPFLISCGEGHTGLAPPEGLTISLSPTTLTMSPGGSFAIGATVRDNTGRVVSGASITRVTSDPSVLVVGVGGTVEALGIGQATVTASVVSEATPNTATTMVSVVEDLP